MSQQESQIRQGPNSDEALLERFLPPNMLVYFARKCPDLSIKEVRTHLAELLKFLILVRDFPGNIIFGKEIDEMWHLWIMQTREYETLCAVLPGGEIRHHSSRDYPEEVLNAANVEAMLQTRFEPAAPVTSREGGRERFEQNAQRLLSFFASYYLTFGPLEERVIPLWPPLQRLAERLGWTVPRLNVFLAEQVRKAEEAKLVAQ